MAVLFSSIEPELGVREQVERESTRTPCLSWTLPTSPSEREA